MKLGSLKLPSSNNLCLQLDPLFTRGYIRMAKCCIITGDIPGASQALDKAQKLEPNNLTIIQEISLLQTLRKHQLDAQQAINFEDRRKVVETDFISVEKFPNNRVAEERLIESGWEYEGLGFDSRQRLAQGCQKD